MPKKKKPTHHWGLPPPKAPRRTRIRALVLIDDEPIRREALADYLGLEREAATLRAQIERFETVDIPAFERWDATTFGPMLTELREVSAKLGEKQRVLYAIEDEMLWSNCSRIAAYRRVMKLINEPPSEADEDRNFSREREAADDPEDPGFSGDAGGMFGGSDLPPGVSAVDFDRMSAAEKRQFHALFETMAELYEAMTGQPAPSLEEALAQDRARRDGGGPQRKKAPLSSAPASPPVHRGADRIKELYRKVVRQLHPDANGEFAPRERELWHEVQAAYQARDLERLEAVAARVEIGGDAGASARTSVGVLLRITRELRDALQSVRRQFGMARKQPAWRFREKKGGLAQIETRRRRQLERALNESRYELTRATTILDDLARRAAQPRGKRRPKPTASQPTQRDDQMKFF